MNQRIKQLAEQCTDYVYGEGGSYEMFDKEKFAELIVAECVKVAMKAVSDDEPKEAWYLIKEHFGVDE